MINLHSVIYPCGIFIHYTVQKTRLRFILKLFNNWIVMIRIISKIPNNMHAISMDWTNHQKQSLWLNGSEQGRSRRWSLIDDSWRIAEVRGAFKGIIIIFVEGWVRFFIIPLALNDGPICWIDHLSRIAQIGKRCWNLKYQFS